MNSRSDRRINFEPDSLAGVIGPAQGSWLPAAAAATLRLNSQYWRTRAARGFSWHRSGLAPQRSART